MDNLDEVNLDQALEKNAHPENFEPLDDDNDN